MQLMAYEGKDGCDSMMCRTFYTADGRGICHGWHCAGCDEPSSQYGHERCRARACDRGPDERPCLGSRPEPVQNGEPLYCANCGHQGHYQGHGCSHCGMEDGRIADLEPGPWSNGGDR